VIIRKALSYFFSLAIFLSPHVGARAENVSEEFIVLRIHQAGGDITVEAPRAFIAEMSKEPTGVTVPIGYFKGSPVRMSADRLIRILRDLPGGGKESLLFTRQTDQGPMAFFARAVSRSVPRRGHPCFLIEFHLSRRGASPTDVSLPLLGTATLGKTLLSAAGIQTDSDIGPLLDRGVECAERLGSGPILKASASDATATVAVR